MRTHTNGFKNAIKQFGKEIDAKITYENTTLGSEDLNSISYHYEGDILKSVMKQLDIDSNVDIPLNTLISLQFGVKVGSTYEYLDYGYFIVYKSEKQEDTGSYKLTCYDKMLYSMQDYVSLGITYPITIKNYINAICTHLGVTFANSSDTFTNHDKQIASELYLDSQGNSLGYTFRDVLDELAEVTGSIICINNDNELEVRYLNETVNNLIDIEYSSGTINNIEYVANKNEISLNGTYSGSDYGTYGRTVSNKNINMPAGNYLLYAKNMPQNTSISMSFYDENNTFITNVAMSATAPMRNITLSKNSIRYSLSHNITFKKDAVTSFNTSYQIYLIEGNNVENALEKIDEEMLKDVNVNFSEKYGPINTIVFTRSGGADKIALSEPEDLADDQKKAIIIEDNQILNGNDRSDYLSPLLSQLYGLNYYLNDFSSTGIAYLELGDVYNVKIGENSYNCVMLNDELNITSGLEEIIHTDISEQAEVEYKTASKSDKLMNKTNLIVDKVNQEISGIIERVEEVEENAVTTTQMNNAITQKIDDNNNNYIASQISTAITTADSHTDNKLNNYSTTTQMNNAITQGITNNNENYISSQISNAITTADGHTNDKLENYSTSTEVTNEITQKIDANNNTYTSVELAKKVNGSDITKAYLMLKLTNNRSNAVLGADEISLSANDVLNLIAGNTINLTSKNIQISADNFSVDQAGNVRMNNATLNGATLTNITINGGSISINPNNAGNGLTIGSDDGFKMVVNSLGMLAYYKGERKFYLSSMGALVLDAGSVSAPTIYGTTRVTGLNMDSGHEEGANSNTWTYVYFGHVFPKVPNVIVTPNTTTAGIITLKTRNITVNGFEVIVGGSGYSNISFDWIAFKGGIGGWED